MTPPLSIRFDPGVLDRLRRRAAQLPGATPSGLAQRLVDEGLRQAEHPGIVFKDGPAGRRAALALGPDIWELVRVLGEIDEHGEAAIEATAELLHLSPSQVRAGLRYYGDHQHEIDVGVDEADAASVAAGEAWRVEQRLPR